MDLGNNKYNKDAYNLYNDNRDHREYIWWLVKIFRIIYDKLVPSGRIAINIGDGKNGRVLTSSDLIHALSAIRYLPFAKIIWDKGDTSNRCAWGSYLSPSCPSFPETFEYILIFAKDSYKLQKEGATDLTKDEFIRFANSIWRFAPETKRIGHPAPFPEELPYRCIKMLSWIGATVLDPFMGSGTTALVCQKLKRKFIGIKLSLEYINLAQERLRKHQEQLSFNME